MDHTAAVIRDIEEFHIPELRVELGRLERGEMQRQQRVGDGPWVDTTQTNAKRARAGVALLEAIVACLRG